MSDVKWIKLAVQMFNVSRKIKNIEKLKGGDTILVIWFKLLCLAGEINDGGAIYIADGVAYTDAELADELRRPLKTVQRALSIFTEYGMIRRDDSGVIYLVSWAKYQNVDGLDKIREQNRIRKQREREKSRTMSRDGHVTVTPNVTECHATDKEIRKKKEEKDFIIERETRTHAHANKKIFGKYENVELTDGEYEELMRLYPLEYDAKIERLSKYMADTGKTYASHFGTIVEWAKADAEKSRTANGQGDYSTFDTDEFFSLAANRRFADERDT